MHQSLLLVGVKYQLLPHSPRTKKSQHEHNVRLNNEVSVIFRLSANPARDFVISMGLRYLIK